MSALGSVEFADGADFDSYTLALNTHWLPLCQSRLITSMGAGAVALLDIWRSQVTQVAMANSDTPYAEVISRFRDQDPAGDKSFDALRGFVRRWEDSVRQDAAHGDATAYVGISRARRDPRSGRRNGRDPGRDRTRGGGPPRKDGLPRLDNSVLDAAFKHVRHRAPKPSSVNHDDWLRALGIIQHRSSLLCRQFGRNGGCPKGDNCHFSHDRSNGGSAMTAEESKANTDCDGWYVRSGAAMRRYVTC